MPSTPELTPGHLPGSYADRLDEANRLFRHGDLDQAAAICQRIIDRISRLPERRRAHDSPLYGALIGAFIVMAEIHAKRGDWPALDDLCARAQAAHPDYAHRWAIEPFVLRIRYGQPQEGIDGLRALAETTPDSFYFWQMLARMALDTEDYDLALAASERAGQVMTPDEDPDQMASYHMVRFRLFQERGQWHEAAHEWKMACMWDDEIEDLQEVVVRMFLEVGLYDDALEYVEDEWLTAIVADYYRAWIAQQRGDVVRARYLWRKIVETDAYEDDVDSPTLRAVAYCWLRQPDAALALMLTDVVGREVVNNAQALALALAWAMHGEVEAALANVKLAVKGSATPSKPDPLLPALEWIDFEQLVTDEAIKAELRPYFRDGVAV